MESTSIKSFSYPQIPSTLQKIREPSKKQISHSARFSPDTSSCSERLRISIQEFPINLDTLQKKYTNLFDQKQSSYFLDEEKLKSVEDFIIGSIPNLYFPDSNPKFIIDKEAQNITQKLILGEYRRAYSVLIDEIKVSICLELEENGLKSKATVEKIQNDIVGSINKKYKKKFKVNFWRNFMDLETLVAGEIYQALQATPTV